MKKFLYSKFFIGLICFCLGFLANHYLTKIIHNSTTEVTADHVPIDPNDFDPDKIRNAVQKMQQDMLNQSDSIAPQISGVERREDNDYVYYDIPLNADEKTQHELKVNVKNGMISITENTKNTQSQREFSIDPGLDEANAKVINQKDKISIKIPKKK